MFNCLRCKDAETKGVSLLCPDCQREIDTKPEEMEKWIEACAKQKKRLKKLKARLDQTVLPYQQKAFVYINHIGKVFGLAVEKERIYGHYILDIYIPKAKTAIEIDGGVHKTRLGKDDNRDEFFKSKRIQTIRFSNREVGTEFFENAVWAIFYQYYAVTNLKRIEGIAYSKGIHIEKLKAARNDV